MHRHAWLPIFFFLAACSSSTDPSTSLEDAAGSETSAQADASTDTATTESSIATDAPPADSGPCGKREQACCAGTTCDKGLLCQEIPTLGPTCLCDTSLCDRFGYVCDGNKSVGCGPTAPGSCYVPQVTRVCPADSPCNPSTGTCGGCDASDPCSSKTDGSFLTCAPYTAEWCRKDSTGCVVTVKESCGIACVGGARQGCCGGSGQMCCSPPGAACVAGLTCTGGTCKP